ncbi:magnesium transporter [Acholeplasma hippikon]|uniref:Magnesium transporter mgtE n=1 Tax=Acholeplasma hippikon TaxID=264636 RepID=A0A449BHV2_9MOLU|nr:magnesium transporter [Acholeplasma hippikon]VEU82028.1 Magnesium transporter mgtE [Acholeplasma hippikon]
MIDINFELPVSKLKEALKNVHPSDIAVLFEDNAEYREKLIEAIGIRRFGEAFIYLNDDLQVRYYLKLEENKKRELLKHFELDDLKTFIELFRVSYHEEILRLLGKERREKVVKLLSYDGDTAGSISSPSFMYFDINSTVKEVTSKVIKESDDNDEIDVIFFHDDVRFVGGLRLQDLIIARESMALYDIVDENYPYAYADDLVASAVRKIRNYDVSVLPVIDDKKVLVGIITADDALDIMKEDHIDAVEGLVALHDHSDASSPLKRSMQRLPWLLMSVVLNIVIATFLTTFSDTIDSNVVLVMFQPMILGMAGNIGTQSIAVTILGLHHEKIKPMRHIRKELFIAIINSLISGLVGVLIVFGFLYLMPNDYADIDKVAMVVGISLVLSMFVSALVGVLLPFILRKLGADEKAASGPIISTVNDFAALGIYFLVATILLINM